MNILKIVLVYLSIVLLSCSNEFSLSGKEFYKISEGEKGINEVKLQFVSKNKVKIIPIVFYTPYRIDTTNSSYISDFKMSFDYTLKDGILTIVGSAIKPFSLTDSGKYYVTSNGDYLYKTSIVDLNPDERRERISQSTHIEWSRSMMDVLIKNEFKFRE